MTCEVILDKVYRVSIYPASLLLTALALLLTVVWALDRGGPLDRYSIPAEALSFPAYPLKVGANKRYLVDQNNLPFMVVGDSPHSMIGRMSKPDAEFYMANRARYGINTTPAPLGTGSVTTDTYATAARTADGMLAIVYMPTIRTITVDMSQLAGPTSARWYDPTTARYANVSASPVMNSGHKQFTPPGKNGDGDGDWVLVLETG
jgi:hypothetical protein